MFKPKYNNKKQRFSFNIDAGIINNRESDLFTGLKGKALDEVTLFIYDALEDDGLSSCNLTDANLDGAVWGNTTCPDGTLNSDTSPCTAEQLNLA